MKKLVVLLSLVATVSAFSQGQVNFVTLNSTPGAAVNAPVTYGDGGPVTAGAKVNFATDIVSGAYHFGGINARTALYAVTGTTTDAGALSIITPSVPFYGGALASYVNATANSGSKTRTVPNSTSGGLATFQIRAWDTGIAPADNSMTFEQAKAIIDGQGAGYYGVGNVFTTALGGGSVAATFLIGAQGFTINWVPEPSIIGLGLLGAIAGMVVFRRRQ